MFFKLQDCPICGSHAILKDKYLKGSANKKKLVGRMFKLWI